MQKVMNYNRYLPKCIQASIDAGRDILDVYHSDFTVEHKADNSPLTLADKRSHQVIVKSLMPFDIPILSEEGKHIPYEERKSWNMFWLVDPIDGTKEFIKRNGEFTVNIALIHHGKPVLGVIFVPVKKMLYFAVRDLGAYRLELNSLDEIKDFSLNQIITSSLRLPIEPSISKSVDNRFVSLPFHLDMSRPYTIMGSRSHATPELKAFVEKKRCEFATVEFISAGSSLKFCLVAEGKADIYPRFGPTMEWDTAAGQAIAENSGARVFCVDTNEPLVYNKENLLNPWFVVSF